MCHTATAVNHRNCVKSHEIVVLLTDGGDLRGHGGVVPRVCAGSEAGLHTSRAGMLVRDLCSVSTYQVHTRH